MRYFDAHSHLYMAQFDADRDAVLARMQEGGVGSIIIGTDLAESRQALELAKQHDFLWASVGLHPNDNATEQFDAAAYEELARNPKVVAIGECGLDYFRSKGEGQKERFLAQISLAEKLQKPLIIHCRDAHDDILTILKEHKPTVPVVMHFFTGSGELAQRYLDLGCYLSFPGPITYTDMYDDSIRVCPVDKMLAETDAPFAAPVPNRGKRNEPSYVAEVVKKLATIKGMSAEALAAHTTANAKKIFALGILLACLMGPMPALAQEEPFMYPAEPVVSLTSVTYVAAGQSVTDKLFTASESMAANVITGTSHLWSGLKGWFDARFTPMLR